MNAEFHNYCFAEKFILIEPNKVCIPTSLRKLTNNEELIEANAAICV